MTQQFLGRGAVCVTLPTPLGRHLPFCPLNDFCQALVLAVYAPIYAADPVAHRQQQPSISPDQTNQRQRDCGYDRVNVHALPHQPQINAVADLLHLDPRWPRWLIGFDLNLTQ
mgnify:CR=1 FL=1